MPGLSSAEKKDRLSRMSYRDFLLNVVKVPAGVLPFYQTRTHGLYGIGIDAVGALECWAFHYPGFDGMNLDPVANGRMSFTARGDATPKPAYEFHLPGRQRFRGAAARARAHAGCRARHDRAGQRPGDDRLREARSRRIRRSVSA